MTEEQIKLLCKLAVDNSKKPLTDAEKEVLKHAIDESNFLQQKRQTKRNKILEEKPYGRNKNVCRKGSKRT